MNQAKSLKRKRHILNALLAKDVRLLSPPDGLRHIGLVTDYASELEDAASLEQAIELAKIVKSVLSDQKDIAKYYFFLGNTWDGLQRLRRAADGDLWRWKQPELEEANRSYRKAYTCGGFNSLPTYRRCQILTNIGNHFDHIGRFVEAIEYWDAALMLEQTFGMAHGNRGLGLYNYARHLYDQGHAAIFLRRARETLSEAVDLPLEGDAANCFRQLLAHIDEEFCDRHLNGEPLSRRFSLGKTLAEREYRGLCLRRRLFLNPLNDLGGYSIAARDTITVPSMTTCIKEGPRFQGFFNQIKQEYVSARFLYHEGCRDRRSVHFSDRDVLLYDTLDYPAYGLPAEQTKLAFRMSYSVLDKLACFLNQYLKLGIAERRVSFRTLWFENQEAKRSLRPELANRKNLPLRGLYWLSRDLADPAEDLREALEPEARDLVEIRNQLEHKSLKLHSEGFYNGIHTQPNRPLADTLSFSINRLAFEQKCLKMLKLARAAIMYLSFTIEQEERRRARDRKCAATKVIPIKLLSFPDQWKR